jgi:hypothetical protein
VPRQTERDRHGGGEEQPSPSFQRPYVDEQLADEVRQLRQRVDGLEAREARLRRGRGGSRTPVGPLYYRRPDEFNQSLESAVEQCVGDLLPITLRNVGQAMQPYRISENTLRSRLRQHKLLARRQTPSEYLRALATLVRKKHGHLLLGLGLVALVVALIIDQLVLADPVIAKAITHFVCELCRGVGDPQCAI